MRLLSPCLLLVPFLPPVSSALEFEPERPIVRHTENSMFTSIEPADLDGDGDLDFVTMAWPDGGSAVNWYENAGNGKFVHAGLWEDTTARPYLLIADFDGDALPDLLRQDRPAAAGDPVPLRILFGDGMAGFGNRQKDLGTAPGFFTLAKDVDGDGIVDLVSSTATLLKPGRAVPVLVTASAVPPWMRFPASSALRWFDWTGDGLPDAHDETGRWWRNQGDGTFAAAEEIFPAGFQGDDCHLVRHRLLPGGRGFIRIVSAADPSTAADAVLFGSDDAGGIDELARLRIASEGEFGGLRAIQTRDEDAAITGIGSNYRFLDASESLFESRADVRRLAVKFRKGKPFLVLKQLIADVPPNAYVAVKAKGSSDLLLATVASFPEAQFILYRAKPRGGYVEKPVASTAPSAPLALQQLVDFDLDGDLDLIATEHTSPSRAGAVAWWENRRHGRSFHRREIYKAPGSLKVVKVLNLDGKGRPEMIVEATRYLGDSRYDSRVMMLRFPTRGGSAEVSTLFRIEDAEAPMRTMAGDWEGDGLVDLMIQDPRGQPNDAGEFPLLWMRGIGAGLFAAPVGQGICRENDQLYDVAGNGFLDLVPVMRPGDPVISWLYHDATGVRHMGAPGTGVVRAAGADLDGDAIPDYLGEGAVPLLWRGLPDLIFEERPALPAGTFHRFHDLDGDGDADAVVAVAQFAPYSSRLMVLENPGDANFGPAVAVDEFTLGQWDDVLAGDLDGDGKTDLVAGSRESPPRISWFKGK